MTSPIMSVRLKNKAGFSLLTFCIPLLVVTLIGFFLYFGATQYLAIQFSPIVTFQIDPLGALMDVLTLVVPVFLTVYVLRTLNRRDEGEKSERNLLIASFKTFDSDLSKVVRDFARGGVKVENVAAFLKRNGMRAQTLLRLTTEEGFLAEDSKQAKALSKKIRNIKDLLTNTPKTGEIEDGIRIVDGKLNYSSNQVDKIANAVFDFNTCIFKITAEINRADRSQR